MSTKDRVKKAMSGMASAVGRAAQRFAGDAVFLACAAVALYGVWHWSPSVALVLAGVGGMAYVVLFGGKRP